MKLALALGKTLRELLDPQTGLNSAEIAEWIAFDRISPFGDWRADYRMGVLAAQQHNMWSESKKSPIDYVPDFMPEPESDCMTGKQVETFLRAYFGVQEAFKKGG